MKARQLNSFCVLCYQAARVGSHYETHSHTFFQSLSKYLNVHLKLGEELDKSSDGELVICADCFEVGKSFSKLYFQWEVLRMQLEWGAREVFDMINRAEGDSPKYSAFRDQFIDNCDSDSERKRAVHSDIQKLRGDILRGCKKIFKSKLPRVVLERTISEDGRNGNNEISRVVPPPNNHSFIQFVTGLLNFFALCHLSLPFEPPKVSETDHHHQHSRNSVIGEGVSTETTGTNSETFQLNANKRKLVDNNASTSSSSSGDEEARIQDVDRSGTSEKDTVFTDIEERMELEFGENDKVVSGNDSDPDKDSKWAFDAERIPTRVNAVGIEVNAQDDEDVNEEFDLGESGGTPIQMDLGGIVEFHAEDNSQQVVFGSVNCPMNGQEKRNASKTAVKVGASCNETSNNATLQNVVNLESTASTSKKITVPNAVEVELHDKDPVPSNLCRLGQRKKEINAFHEKSLNEEQQATGKVDNDPESTTDSVIDERVSAETTIKNSTSAQLHAKKRKLVSSATHAEVNDDNETREASATVGVGAATASPTDDENNASTSSSNKVGPKLGSRKDDEKQETVEMGTTDSITLNQFKRRKTKMSTETMTSEREEVDRIVSPESPPPPLFGPFPQSSGEVSRQPGSRAEVPVTERVGRGASPHRTEFATLENGKVKCGCCNHSFASLTTYNQHVADKRKENHPCDACSKIFTATRNLSRHKREIHGNEKFPCPHCGFQFTRASSLIQHLSKNRCKGGLEGGLQQ